MNRIIYLFTLLIITASVVRAQSTFSANRPGQVNNPDIVPGGYFMIETGIQYGKTTGNINFIIPTTFLRYGLNQNFEINLKAENIYQPGISLIGLTNYNIGSKIKICDQNNLIPKITLVTTYLLPFAGLDTLRPDYGGGLIQLAVSHSLGNKCTVYSNLGVLWNGNDPFPSYNYVLSLYYSPFIKFWAFAELYGLIPERGTGSIGSDCGFSCQAGENLQLDLSLGGDLSDIQNNHYIQIGAAFQIVKRSKKN